MQQENNRYFCAQRADHVFRTDGTINDQYLANPVKFVEHKQLQYQQFQEEMVRNNVNWNISPRRAVGIILSLHPVLKWDYSLRIHTTIEELVLFLKEKGV